MSYVPNQAVSAENGEKMPRRSPVEPRTPFILKLLRLGFQIGGRVSPGLAGRIAYALWFRPSRHRTPDAEIKLLRSAACRQVEINHHSIATYSWGQSGPMVLLVHGWSGRGSQLGAFARPLLDSGFRVIGFDAPAHGNSSGSKTNIFEIADVIVGLQNHFGTFDSVITHSFGGPCTALALQRGFETKRIASLSPPATTRWLVERFQSVLRIPEKAGRIMMRRFETEFGSEIWDRISMVNSVRDITIPGLLIHDNTDKEVPLREGRAVADAWTSARLIKTSGLGHRRILRDKAVIDSVVDFITAETANGRSG